MSIFLEVKVRDLVAVQRRDAGRAKHEILKKIKKHEGCSPSYSSALAAFPAPGRRRLPYFSQRKTEKVYSAFLYCESTVFGK